MDAKLASRFNPVGSWALAALALCAPACISSAQGAETNILSVPTITIYPGEVIKDNWLTDREFSPAALAPGASFAYSRGTLVGKIARRTLLPGTPIPSTAVSDPKVVATGAKVRIVFEEGALSIMTYGTALQSGGVGDLISVRNLDSGLTISGTVQSDGSVRVSGS